MQTHVNCVYDSELDKLSDEKQPGIRQVSGRPNISSMSHYALSQLFGVISKIHQFHILATFCSLLVRVRIRAAFYFLVVQTHKHQRQLHSVVTHYSDKQHWVWLVFVLVT